MIIGQRFIRYKEKVTELRAVVERHFNTLMNEIMNGLPSIMSADDVEDDEVDSRFGKQWTCRTCKRLYSENVAASKQSECYLCQRPKFVSKYKRDATGYRIGVVKKN